MAYRGIDHIALRVPDLKAAEEYYCALFAATVLFREAPTADGWRTLPSWAGWADAEAAGFSLQLSVIGRDRVQVALFAAVENIPASGLLDHVAIEVGADDIHAVRRGIAALGGAVQTERNGVLIFDDRFGIRWEMTTKPEDYGNNGEMRGRWLDVAKKENESLGGGPTQDPPRVGSNSS